MQDSEITNRIELVLKNDQKTPKKYILNQCDYNFSPSYNIDDNKDFTIDINLTGGLITKADAFFMEWISKKNGKWSGSLKVYNSDSNEAKETLEFDEIIPTGYNQAFTEYIGNVNAGYFYANLKGVKLMDVKLN
ncbi:hypothetical protein [Lacinutrix sp. 5H-3-7-4]|uniref:hypothetical protein n=1 Tax=Lacinutrix sp. (strain 5H-3-7-4) TaxID=983544 RepID=UPI00020A3CF9|nr:hypothetical protein [Lacinutrix sp. 5H-3-7-4]AEH01950.1 hypothetical protein Lacal_2104 [Lacinutrix sp. 5H-3-7-4]